MVGLSSHATTAAGTGSRNDEPYAAPLTTAAPPAGYAPLELSQVAKVAAAGASSPRASGGGCGDGGGGNDDGDGTGAVIVGGGGGDGYVGLCAQPYDTLTVPCSPVPPPPLVLRPQLKTCGSLCRG